MTKYFVLQMGKRKKKCDIMDFLNSYNFNLTFIKHIMAMYSCRLNIVIDQQYFQYFGVFSINLSCFSSSNWYWGEGVQIYTNYAIPSFAYVGSAFSCIGYYR